MENKIRINLGVNLELVAELYNYDGDHPEIIVYIEKDGIIHQDVCLVRPHDGDSFVEEKYSADCIVWSDPYDEDYTHKFEIGVYEEE